MLGGAALLADGMITPPISVTSAIEGLKQTSLFSEIHTSTVVMIVLVILAFLFFAQQFGTASIGKMFGPIMLLWFGMLAVMGGTHIADDLYIFKAINPYYAIRLLTVYPDGFWLLGAVFLCTTGAEALYSDLGHCGRGNIRMSWIYVKIALILNYLGQGAWLLANHHGKTFSEQFIEAGFNPFYGIMPAWFVPAGVVIATAAAIIASQALISGSFTLISESMRLNLWPKLRINYPTEARGQLYISGINTMLFIGCCGIVIYFKTSSNMGAAYGLAITLCMLATSILFANFLISRRTKRVWVYLYLTVYITLELSFLIANLIKFPHGGYVATISALMFFMVMFIWYKGRKIKNRFLEFGAMKELLPKLLELSEDQSVPKFASHVVFLTSANYPSQIETKFHYSIFSRKPKRSDTYWFVHVDVADEPYTSKYEVDVLIPNVVYRIDFRLGFRIEPRVNVFLRRVIEDMVVRGEVDITSRYESLNKHHLPGDFRFVVLEKFLSYENDLSFFEKSIMDVYFFFKTVSLSEGKEFGLDSSLVTIEKLPLLLTTPRATRLERDEVTEEELMERERNKEEMM